MYYGPTKTVLEAMQAILRTIGTHGGSGGSAIITRFSGSGRTSLLKDLETVFGALQAVLRAWKGVFDALNAALGPLKLVRRALTAVLRPGKALLRVVKAVLGTLKVGLRALTAVLRPFKAVL